MQERAHIKFHTSWKKIVNLVLKMKSSPDLARSRGSEWVYLVFRRLRDRSRPGGFQRRRIRFRFATFCRFSTFGRRRCLKSFSVTMPTVSTTVILNGQGQCKVTLGATLAGPLTRVDGLKSSSSPFSAQSISSTSSSEVSNVFGFALVFFTQTSPSEPLCDTF